MRIHAGSPRFSGDTASSFTRVVSFDMRVVLSFSTSFVRGIFSIGPLPGGPSHHSARYAFGGRKRQIGIHEQHSDRAGAPAGPFRGNEPQPFSRGPFWRSNLG